MYFIVIGCGRVGSEIAYRLFRSGHEVTVVDEAGVSFKNLHPDFRGRTIEGEVLARRILKRAEIERADGLAAVTNSDTVNAVVGRVARDVFRVPNVVVRNYDPKFLPLHVAFGHETVGSAAWGSQRMEEMLCQPAGRAVLAVGGGEVNVYEIRVPESWRGRLLRALIPEEQAVAVALTRAGKSVVPSAETVLEAEDLLHVSATRGGIEDLNRKVSGES